MDVFGIIYLASNDSMDHQAEKKEIIERAILDGALNILQLAKHLEDDSPEAISKVNAIINDANTQKVPPEKAAENLGIDYTIQIQAFILYEFVSSWKIGGDEKILSFLSLNSSLTDSFDGSDQNLYSALSYTASNLALLSLIEDTNAKVEIHTADGFFRLAQILINCKQSELAVKCAISSANFYLDNDLDKRLKVVEFAVSIGDQLLDPSYFSDLLAMRAHLWVSLALDQPEYQFRAYQLMDNALRHPPQTEELTEGYDQVIQSALTIGAEFLKPLFELYQISRYSTLIGQIPNLPPVEKGNEKILDLIWTGDDADLESWLQSAGALAKDISDGSIAADKTPKETFVIADWKASAFKLPAFRRSVPYGKSFLLEDDKIRNRQIAVLSHEVTHLLSMLGNIGGELQALRACVCLCELGLWSFSYEIRENDPDAFLKHCATYGVASLTDKSLLTFALTEKSIDLTQKANRIETIWTPWFEGLAIFAEHAADPTLDSEWHTPVNEVLSNIVDFNLQDLQVAGIQSEKDFNALLHNNLDKIEKLISQSLDYSGKLRLRSYIDNNHRHYLAGYIAIRQVVASWRKTLGLPISGPQAMRALLHVTQFGSSNVHPPSSLPFEDYSPLLLKNFLEWLDMIMSISREDLIHVMELERTGDNEARSSRWSDDMELEHTTDEDKDRKYVHDFIHKRTLNAFSEKPSTCIQKELFAPFFSQWFSEVEDAALNFTQQIANARSTLTLGVADCPFMLLENSSPESKPILQIFIRTREKRKTDGKPTNSISFIPISSDKAIALKDEIQKRKEHLMTATRIAWVGNVHEGFIRGQNFIILSYGEWSFVLPVGQQLSIQETPQEIEDFILSQYKKTDFLLMEEELFSSGEARCKKTIDELNPDMILQINELDDPSIWIASILERAQMGLKPSSNGYEEINIEILTKFIGREGANAVFEEGLISYLKIPPLERESFIEALHKSGKNPSPLSWLDEQSSERIKSFFEEAEYGWDFHIH